MKSILISFIAIALVVAASAQIQLPKPPKETSEFDFWIGTWDANGRQRTGQGADDFKDTKGKNKITRTMNGHVVHEEFTGDGPIRGMSVSVYNPNTKKWNQTWVDNTGGYIALSGGMEDGKMVLTTLPNPNRPNASSRMVFYDIKKDSFTWDWESSTDAGKTWVLQWRIHYKRAKK